MQNGFAGRRLQQVKSSLDGVGIRREKGHFGVRGGPKTGVRSTRLLCFHFSIRTSGWGLSRSRDRGMPGRASARHTTVD